MMRGKIFDRMGRIDWMKRRENWISSGITFFEIHPVHPVHSVKIDFDQG
jgi:hypothetical protein